MTDQLGTHPQELTLEQNGSFRIVTTIMKGGKGLVATDSGTWTAAGDKITYTFTDTKWKTPGADSATSARIQQRFSSEKTATLANMNAIGPITVRWVDENKFVEVTPQGEMTFTRKQ